MTSHLSKFGIVSQTSGKTIDEGIEIRLNLLALQASESRVECGANSLATAASGEKWSVNYFFS